MKNDKKIKLESLEYTKYYLKNELNNRKIRRILSDMKIRIFIFVIGFIFFINISIHLLTYPIELEIKLMTIFVMFVSYIIFCTLITNDNYGKYIDYKEVIVSFMLRDKYPNSLYMCKNITFNNPFKDYSLKESGAFYTDFISYNINSRNVTAYYTTSTDYGVKDKELVIRNTKEFNGFIGFYPLYNSFKNEMFMGTLSDIQRKVKIDNEKFNEKFDLISEDMLETYKILTPSTMEKLLDLKNKVPSLEFIFKDNKIYFKFECENYFKYAKNKKVSALNLYKLVSTLKFIYEMCSSLEKEINDRLS